MPHSTDREYSERAIPQYERAVVLSGGDPVRVPLDRPPKELKGLIAGCDGILLPGSKADIDPSRFEQEKTAQTAAADLHREAVDNLLLEDAYVNRKPVLGICYGLQSINVFRKGSLVQHIPDFLPEATRTKINHEAGRSIQVAHTVEIEPESLLSMIVDGQGVKSKVQAPGSRARISVNSSHHQSAHTIGDGLRVAARCPDDEIIEALEGTSSDHFVLAVQWHPERSVEGDRVSLAIFGALITAAI